VHTDGREMTINVEYNQLDPLLRDTVSKAGLIYMYIYIYIHMYIYEYVYSYVYAYVHIFLYLFIRVY
jgi:hypothetical protein